MKLSIEVQLDGCGVLDRIERAAIVQAMELAGGNVTVAAQLLGIHRQSLQRKIRRLEIASGAEFKLWSRSENGQNRPTRTITELYAPPQDGG